MDALEELIAKRMAEFNALSEAEKAAERRDQAISRVYGEMCLGLNDDNASGVSPLTREQIGELYDAGHRAR